MNLEGQTEIENLNQLTLFAEELNQIIARPSVLFLQGELGAGKTSFVKALASTYGYSPDAVKSPTFTLLQSYQFNQFAFHHLDLYRLTENDHLVLAELKEILKRNKDLIAIEWPERLDYSELDFNGWQLINLKFEIVSDLRIIYHRISS